MSGVYYMADNVKIDGLIEQQKALEALMIKNPAMEKKVQSLIRKVLGEVRRAMSNEAKSAMKSDPRQAYKAVKTAVYRQILGGNVSILNKKKAGTQFSSYEPPRKLTPGQRGGNRVKRSPRTEDLVHYAGPDRGFVLRFLNAGTGNRNIKHFNYDENRKVDKWNKHPNTGFRGSISPRNWFGNRSQKEMENAADHLTQLIDELIKQELQ